MPMYKQLVKGSRYAAQLGGMVRSGTYLGRYKSPDGWRYKFCISYGVYWTPEASKVKIL